MELSSASTTIPSGDLSFSAQMATYTSMRNASILLMRRKKQRETGFQPFLADMRSDRTQHLPVRSLLSPNSAYVIKYHKNTSLKHPKSITYHLPTELDLSVTIIKRYCYRGI
jgi:hypothetical protein